VRRTGWLIGGAGNDLTSQDNKTALQEALAKLGWIAGLRPSDRRDISCRPCSRLRLILLKLEASFERQLN
jgi:hypothetical protein